MKTDKNILIAFILNFVFSIFEFIGGTLTGSVAIISDAIHDLGDALSIGFSFFMEKISHKKPDKIYTYGYTRYSVIGSLVTTVVLLVGSVIVFYNAVIRIINPVKIDYNGMIVFAVFGVVVNFIAAYFTRDGKSLNQKAVNLHMLEDVLGWIVVLIGAVIMRFTDFWLIDPVMSMGVALFIFINALKNLIKIENLFLEKIPEEIDVEKISAHILEIDGVIDIHHIHIWSLDGYSNYATMHIVTDNPVYELKKEIREELKEHNIVHVTMEFETTDELCDFKECSIEHSKNDGHCHHHHHHHH